MKIANAQNNTFASPDTQADPKNAKELALAYAPKPTHHY
jgi:hypothetical protein